MGEYLLTTMLPKQRNTGANSQGSYRGGLANGSSFMGFPLTGRWQNALVQAWWKFLRQEALVKLSVFLEFRLSFKCFGIGLLFSQILWACSAGL